MRFKVNTPPVIHQTLDGEVIVVNLDTGTYYSITGSGAAIWAALERGSSVDETVDETLGRYDVERETVEAAIGRFVETLSNEQLIAPAPNGSTPEPNGTAHANGAERSETRGTFGEPSLDKHTDLQDLLMLDPIHEVDEQGWPSGIDTRPLSERGGEE
ncbi:MAG TPA: PqqD family protein [Gaiellaceae bacterium]